MVCAVGGGIRESPSCCIAPSKCTHRNPGRGGGGGGGREGPCVNQRACAVPPPLSPSIPSSLCIAQSVSVRVGPLPPHHGKAPSLVNQCLHQHHTQASLLSNSFRAQCLTPPPPLNPSTSIIALCIKNRSFRRREDVCVR